MVAAFFPAQVEGQSDPYFVLKVLRVIRCIDEARSEEVQHWKPEDGNPEKVGITGPRFLEV